jgi:AraC family transcriptional regulator
MNPTQDTYRHRILKVQLHIQEHLDEDLSLERLARLAHFSPFHFHRIFSALVGESVHDYVRRLRLEAAAMLLMTTERPITRIAFDSGYDTHESFTRAFRQMFGVSPSQFRAGQRGDVPLTPTRPTKEERTMTTLTTTPEVQIRTIEPLRVAFLRHVGPYRDVGPTYERLTSWAAQRGLFVPGALVLGISWDNPEVTSPEKVRHDCCITVGPDFQAEGEVGVQTLDGGDYAVATHRGSYEQLGAVFGWLYGTWLPASGREPRHGPCFSVYHNSSPHTPPEQLVTDIYLPLEPR